LIQAEERAGAYQKARQINVDASRHGTFAEIGAGQEVARWFFRVGGAAATVAKTISAYDMAVSDAIYGPSDRYVSRLRLQSMLDYEYELLHQRLGERLGFSGSLFVFADTASMGSSTRQEAGKAWVGIRFQHEPKADPSEIILHVRMPEPDNVRKQAALGILGVNLIHGAFYSHTDPTALLWSLRDELTRERLEVDMIRFAGPAFTGVDNRLMSLQLVEQGFTDAAMFDSNGQVIQPAEILFEQPVLVERGSFRPITLPSLDLMERANAQFSPELAGSDDEPVVIMEMSLRNLISGDSIDHADFLARVDILAALGLRVMISRYSYYYGLAEYLRYYTHRPIVFALGVPNLKRLFEEQYYTELDGGILESMGRLFRSGIRLFVYPCQERGKLVSVESLEVAPNLRHLYAHLLDNGMIIPIREVDSQHLHIFPKDVLRGIETGNPEWESMVPAAGVKLIKERRVFGYRSRTPGSASKA
jgi:hypothetical protein